jgi:hypothetical protein
VRVFFHNFLIGPNILFQRFPRVSIRFSYNITKSAYSQSGSSRWSPSFIAILHVFHLALLKVHIVLKIQYSPTGNYTAYYLSTSNITAYASTETIKENSDNISHCLGMYRGSVRINIATLTPVQDQIAAHVSHVVKRWRTTLLRTFCTYNRLLGMYLMKPIWVGIMSYITLYYVDLIPSCI